MTWPESSSEKCVVVELPLSDDHTGAVDDLARRHELEDMLGRALVSAEAGECDGGGQGFGVAEIFLYGPSRAAIVAVIRPLLPANARIRGESG